VSSLLLVCHPSTPCEAVAQIDAAVVRTPGGLNVVYRIQGNLELLKIPSPRAPATGERLWQHTCCELFVAPRGASAYHEFNFSPSGEWASYAFQRYRDGGPFYAPDPRIALQRGSRLLELAASAPAAEGALLLGLTAVIEETNGRLSYWALKHPAGKPDFHHPEAFALELA
jgi:hypothetical protein